MFKDSQFMYCIYTEEKYVCVLSTIGIRLCSPDTHLTVYHWHKIVFIGYTVYHRHALLCSPDTHLTVYCRDKIVLISYKPHCLL